MDRPENVDVRPSLEEEKVEYEPKWDTNVEYDPPFVRETESYVTSSHCRRRCGSGGLYLTWMALSDAPHDEVFVEGCTRRHMLQATPEQQSGCDELNDTNATCSWYCGQLRSES